MTSFYGRLQRHQSRPGREPLEDFLTEALSDLLGRMPKQTAIDFAADLFFADVGSRAHWRRIAASARTLDWPTQVWIDGLSCRIDMLATADGEPLLGVEAKVWAGYQRHRAPGDDPEATQTQLHTYGQWLALARAGDRWAGALALLTFGSPPPDGFLDPNDRSYGLDRRCVARGPAVWKRLKTIAEEGAKASDLATHDPAMRPAWVALAFEFCAFLTEKNMSAETMTSTDYALTEGFLPTYLRLENTFTRIWGVAEPFRRACGNPNRFTGMELQSDGSLVWGWFYLRPEFALGTESFVAFGLLFPMAGNTFFAGATPPLPEAPCAIVSWKNELTFEEPQRPTEAWSRTPEGDLIVTKPLSDFPALDGDKRADAIGAWALERMTELRPALEASKASGVAGAPR